MALPSYQSLYRRYRPQRFSEVLGQDHVTRALRNAVRDGRIGHAYLFSGPRGTGKTSTARILAKVLNCAAPKDGEPCGECENCLTVERGQVTDWLLEQDAASKSKVDDMRDLLDRVPLGTSGNRKVIILDEVHMLSQGAENALLKTLEEPPEHVVFVLATTDPQKVRPTIRSRTQHFEFHLLPPDLVAEHVRHVIHDAGLELDDEAGAVDHVVRLGGGSARDTLSALDQVAALGEVMSHGQPVDAIIEALATNDAGAALVGVAEAMATGRDPRGLGEALIGRLRDAFLAIMGVADDHLPADERRRAAEVGERLGAAGLTRALEVLGEALTELSRKPDPRVVLEVALVRLTRPEADRSLDAVVARLERLENALQSGEGLPACGPGTGRGQPGPTRAAPASAGDAGRGKPRSGGASSSGRPGAAGSGGPRPAGRPDDGGSASGSGPATAARAALAASRPGGSKPRGSGRSTRASVGEEGPPPSAEPGGTSPETATAAHAVAAPAPRAARSASAQAVAAPPETPPSGGPAKHVQGAARQAAAESDGTAQRSGAAPSPSATASAPEDLAALTSIWSATILGDLPPSVRSRWRGGRWIEPLGDGVVRFAMDNEWHQRACEDGRREVEQVLAAHFGTPVRVELTVEGRGSTRAHDHGPEPDPLDEPDAAEIEDVSALPDADHLAVGGVDLLLREFGGELVEEDPR